MTQKEKFNNYKAKLLAKLLQLKNAHDELKAFFDEEEDFDCNDFICDDYPFEKSFDEINIDDWIYAIASNLIKYETKLEEKNE